MTGDPANSLHSPIRSVSDSSSISFSFPPRGKGLQAIDVKAKCPHPTQIHGQEVPRVCMVSLGQQRVFIRGDSLLWPSSHGMISRDPPLLRQTPTRPSYGWPQPRAASVARPSSRAGPSLSSAFSIQVLLPTSCFIRRLSFSFQSFSFL